MPHIAFLLHSHALLTGLTMPAEMFRAAEELYRVRHRSPPDLELSTVTSGDHGIHALSTITVAPSRRLGRLGGVDLLYLPPVWRRPPAGPPGVLDAIRRLAAGGTAVCAVSTGAYLLAAAGLLDGQVATTHWSFLDDFAGRFPEVVLKRDHLITRAGELYCTGSLNSTADLTTYFIERFYDAETARGVEAQFSPEVRRPASELGFFAGEIGAQPDELMAEAQQWLDERLAEPVDLDELCRHLGLSRRSLNRRFRQATGRTPVRFLQELRIEQANALLRNSNLAIAEIASRVGYEDAGHFATLYRRLTGSPPSRYRASVRAKLFTAE